MPQVNSTQSLKSGDALLIVDVQPDFCPGGALPIENGDQVIPVLNEWIKEAKKRGIPIYASRDWHPSKHLSFEQQGGPWPPHCVQDTPGAQFHPKLNLPDETQKVSKGVRLDKDQYSAFDDTGLGKHMRDENIQRVWIGGLAQDVCVAASACDCAKEGFETYLIQNATFPVSSEGGKKSLEKMEASGVHFVES